MKKFIKKINKNYVTSLILLASLVLNLLLLLKVYSIKKTLVIDDNKTIADIEQYLDTISPNFTQDVQGLAKEYNVPSWGCGPSSYALAKILNRKFFKNQLSIDASYDNHSYEIVERFSFAKGNPNNEIGVTGVDHGWLEIYLKDKFLFIDPTIGQFGRGNKIAYQVFKVGDPEIANFLEAKYGIIDVRLKRLVQKTVDRVPISQEPYPGQIISQNDLDYYLRVIQDRDFVDLGKEPVDWKDWVDVLTSKYY